MATNKQPMLVDRPLQSQVSLGALACLVTAGNWNTPAPGGLTRLASGDENGACIDSIRILTTQASTTTTDALFFVSSQSNPSLITAENTRLVTWIALATDVLNGVLFKVPLPSVLVPVPVVSVTAGPAPSEDDRKNTAIMLEAGQYLYAGVTVPITAPSTVTRVIVIAQGGYY